MDHAPGEPLAAAPMTGTGGVDSISSTLERATTAGRGRGIVSDALLAKLLDAARLGTWQWTPQPDTIVADARSFELMGVTPHDGATRASLFALAHDDDRASIEAAFDRSLASGEAFEQAFRIVGEDTKVRRWVAVRGAALPDAASGMPRLLGVAFDVTAAKEAEEALRRSEERFQLAMGAVSGIVYDWDLVGGSVHRSGGVADLMGIAPEQARATQAFWVERIHPEDRDRALGELHAWLDGDAEYFSHEYRLRHEDGHWRHIWDQGRILRDASGKAVRLVGSSTDITARKQAEDRQRMLMAELDHRVKNILANIGAIANRTGQRSVSVKAFIGALEGRIRAMAMAHSLLSASRWQGANFRTLLEEELAPFASPTGVNVSFDGPDMLLRPKAAQSLALALHELVTNAAKHGSLSTPEGRVDVTWNIDESTEPGKIVVVWRESKGPPASEPESKGFGLTVLQDMVAHDLGAEVQCLFASEGMTWTISFPIKHTVDCDAENDPAGIPLGGTAASPLNRGSAKVEGRRILLVEDAWVVGVQLKTILEVMGHEVVGPATTLEEGLVLADLDNLHCAILDIRLDEVDVFPVAEKLRARRIPFGFATGYTDEHCIPIDYRDVPRIAKPYSDGNISELIERLFANG